MGSAFADSLRGINIFRISKKLPARWDFESVKTVSLTQNGKNFKWTTLGSAFADSLRGIKHFGILVSEGEIGFSSSLHGTN